MRKGKDDDHGSPSAKIRKTFSATTVAYNEYRGNADSGALLIDGLYNNQTRRESFPRSDHLDHAGLPLRGPVCTFMNVQSAVEACQLESYEVLLSSVSQNLYVLIIMPTEQLIAPVLPDQT